MGRACFEKSRKRVTSIDVDVPRLRVDGAVAKSGFLDADAVTRKDEMRGHVAAEATFERAVALFDVNDSAESPKPSSARFTAPQD